MNFGKLEVPKQKTPEEIAAMAGDLELVPLEGERSVVAEAPAEVTQLANDTAVSEADDAAKAEALLAQIKGESLKKPGNMEGLSARWSELLQQKAVNLRRRTNREISGMELDQLDVEIDKEIDALREEMLGSKRAIKEEEIGTGRPLRSFEKQKLTPEELLVALIDSSTNRRNLMRALSEHGEITASDGYVYEKGYFIPIIDNLTGPDDPNLQKVTSTGGLREKVRKILKIEEIEKGS